MIPLSNSPTTFSQASAASGSNFNQLGNLKVNIRQQSNTAVGANRDTASISSAALSQLQGSGTTGALDAGERDTIDPQTRADRRERGEALRDRLLDRARSGGIGVRAVSNALSRLDERFDLDSTAFVEEYTNEFQANKPPRPSDPPEAAEPERMTKLRGKLKAMASEIDQRAEYSDIGQERVQKLKTMLHERARAAYAQQSEPKAN